MNTMGLNPNLITLKCVLFLFFGALGALLPFIPNHITKLGLPRNEAIIISAIAPLIALIGPLVAAPLSDRLAGGAVGGPRSKTGRYLRVMISTCCVLATIFYWLLTLVPPVMTRSPEVSFMCDESGGFILQDKCGGERPCYDWGSRKGVVLVKNCIFSCNTSTSYKGETTTAAPLEDASPEYADYYDGAINIINEPEGVAPPQNPADYLPEPYPHLCFKNASDNDVCEVYTEFFSIKLMLGLTASLELQDNTTEDVCKYPFDEPFHCRIPTKKADELRRDSGDPNCNPVVTCAIQDPYNNSNSLLKQSQCGYNNISYWLYLFIKSFADIFVAAAVTLLATAVVIATRETSTGRGDIGKQYACAALGFGLFAPIIGGCADGRFFEAAICFTVLMALAVIILLVDEKMPLSPPEWWWHTRCGLLALPMSAVRSYGLETAALAAILFSLGVFWNSIDSFLPWHIAKLSAGTSLIIGLTITVGAIPAVLFLIFAEKIVDYCGHSNILIFCFVNYILHHLALLLIDTSNPAPYLLLCEFLEIFTLHVMYVTAVLYLRHLVPRKLTACGQALPVIAHFCLGRFVGAFLGGTAHDEYPYNFTRVHQAFTIAAAIVAFIYYCAYHFYLKPKCAAPVHLPPDPAPAIIQSMNGNGSYTPLRVYHNSKSKKGHFRY
ncbi:unnamed protein product [Ceutorhynchus assimilis]|uniref:Major facilitator superfamily associated domain-containing protein n=1 Tax=Ceutorhynchus assimilis TaxID=467358 RepID=A0A9N9MNM7_9CUCU|nr:unnamed protein product [Ceutorhynchus assimilis]